MDSKWKKVAKGILKTILWIAGVVLALMIVLQLVLTRPVVTKIIDRYAPEYIDGDLNFGDISVSMFRRFPSVSLTLEDCSVTYPADRFDDIEKEGAQGYLMRHGCSEQADTLASFHRFTVAVNLHSLLTGSIHIPYLRLDKPRVFAHSYADGSANWDMFSFGSPEKEAEDSIENSSSMPKIILGRIRMSGRPHFVYTNSRDTVFAMANIRNVTFNGKINTKKVTRHKAGISIDSVFVAGRLGRDTLSFGLEKLHMHKHEDHVDVDAAARAFVATRAFGRMMVPINMNGLVSFPKDSIPGVDIQDFKLDIAYIPLRADASIRFKDGATSVKSQVSIDGCKVSDLLSKYAVKFMPDLGKLDTDAKIFLSASCDGDYIHANGQLPEILAKLSIKEAGVSHSSIPGQELRFGMEINGNTDSKGRVDIDIKKLDASAKGLDLKVKGNVGNVLGKDPSINIDGGLTACIDSLAGFIPDSLSIEAKGVLEAKFKGKALMSQLNIYNFSSSSLTGEIYGSGIDINMPEDTISAVVDGLKIVIGPEKKTVGRKHRKDITLMGVMGEIGNADISYKEKLTVKASDFRISAKNAIDDKGKVDTTKKIHPFGGNISTGKLVLKDSEGSVIQIDSTSNSFQILPQRGTSNVPLLTFNSRNKKIFVKTGVSRAIVADADIRARASLNTYKKRQMMNAFRDSLARVYPDIPKDSLFRHMMAQKGPRPELPDWLKEEDFRKQDIDIRLDKTVAKYFRDWDLKGSIDVKGGLVMTPYFPLRNVLKGFELDFTNDRIAIDKFAINSGNSDISATGELKGLKGALLGRRGVLKLDVDVKSEGMDANQLLAAYTKGSTFQPENFKVDDTVSNEEFLEQVVMDSTVTAAAPSLIVVPANLIADISLDASDIKYSELRMNKVTAKLTMKERCVQITDTRAATNMGDISLEGFYSTRSKKDLKTGFSLNFKDITAEKVINLMPAIDTIMPLLKSFGGLLNCEVAATAQLDTNMNLIMPSIDGIVRIGGENLTIKDNEMFRRLAKMLVFKNKNEGYIDRMTVEGVIDNSKLEVFPFILEMDRYTLGLSGVQNMDMSFRYHASLIRSPFLIKVGMDIYGDDFDDMKFKIGKAKYRSKDIPVFSTVIDQTKVNLVESIRNIFDKGVDAAMRENASQNAIDEHKKKIGYVQAVDQKMEELSEQEQKQFEQEQAAQEAPATVDKTEIINE